MVFGYLSDFLILLSRLVKTQKTIRVSRSLFLFFGGKKVDPFFFIKLSNAVIFKVIL